MSETFPVMGSGGLRLMAERAGDPQNPVVVCIHGFPDNRSLWGPVTERLRDRFCVVTYDVRGAGESETPATVADYHLRHLLADLHAVLDEVAGDRPVHLVGHDWGSVQGWAAAADPALRARLASYTAMSAPPAWAVPAWVASVRRYPGRLPAVLTQFLRSSYVGLFNLPAVPEALWARTGPAFTERARRSGAPPTALADRSAWDRPEDPRDGINGFNLYRENFGRTTDAYAPPPDGSVDLPVQVLVPRGDPYLSPGVYDDLGRWCPRLWVRRLAAPHWVPLTHPDTVADAITQLVEHVESGARGRPAPELARAQVMPAPAAAEAAEVVVVTGAASGIGRATAHAFAREGAALVLVDVDKEGLARTAHFCSLLGAPVVEVHRVDVSDAEAVDEAAAMVVAAHGAPDVVVNNAGIGVAGRFVDIGREEWDRILGVNLLGVVHGCQAFVPAMVRAGRGGQLVNLSSAAVWMPSPILSAYAATKGAVLALSENLRVELAPFGIGVTAVCPGVINTGIMAATTYVGALAGGDTAERITAAYQRRNYSPDRVATAIVAAVRKDRAVAPVSPEAHLARFVHRLAPGAVRAAAGVASRTEAQRRLRARPAGDDTP